jgi:predicted regulator of Ras-like GTPase activity (Roadblock/LC7/MglB family)
VSAVGSADVDVPATLGTLRDVAGITGSFVFGDDGRLVAREIPPLFDDAALAEASGRLTRLRDTFAAVGDTLEVAVVRFRDHKLYLKTLGGGMLCIVADGGVNMPALRMAANLVSRRIGPAVERAAREPTPLPPPIPETPALEPRHLAHEAPPGMRRFRGRPVE